MRWGLGLALAAGFALSSCGVAYISPRVSDRNADVDFEVVEIRPATISAANATPYVPRSLPAAFSAVAGSGALRGAGALPVPPVTPDLAPGALVLRPPPPVDPGAYRLGIGDVIRLAVRAPRETTVIAAGNTLNSQLQLFTVRGDGAISLPEVGSVPVAGMTLEDAEARLFERFVEAGLDPTFSLEVQEFHSNRITVGGSVRTGTVVPVGFELPSIDEVLTAAGGLAVTDPEYASIRIYREGSLYQIPLADYRSRPELRRISLLGGDQVFVDTTYDLDRALDFYETQISIAQIERGARQAALGALATEIGIRRAELDERRNLFRAREELGANHRDYVYIAGEVTAQRRWPLPYEDRASLADALYEASGFPLETANASQIYVLRANRTGAVTAWHLDASNALNLTLATAFEMRPNDVIFVEEQPVTRFQRASSQFIPQLLTIVNAAPD